MGKTLIAVHHGSFRGLEEFAGSQVVIKPLRLDTHHQTGAAKRIHTCVTSKGDLLKNLAKKAISASAVIADLKKKLETARQDARIWKDRYEALQAQTKDFLAALKKAPEAVKNFISRILHMEKKEPEQEKKQQEHTLVK